MLHNDKKISVSLLYQADQKWRHENLQKQCLPKKKGYLEGWKINFFTMVVGKDAAQTPSRLSVRSSTPDATT